MNIGNVVWLKEGMKLAKGIVVDIDLTYITLKVEYKKGQPVNVKVKRNSNCIINGIDTEAFLNSNKYMI